VTDQQELFLGVDMGTGGVRCVAVGADGCVAAQAAEPFEPEASFREGDCHEQSPEAWWRTFCRSVGRLLDELDRAGVRRNCLAAMAVDGTSGTVAMLDRDGQPLRRALMYNDGRAVAEAELLNRQTAFCEKLGYRFAASYALAKILWVRQHEPDLFAAAAHFAHQADFLVGRLTGRYDLSDYSNALKTGYDLVDERWPDWFDQWPGLRDRLPQIVAPGTPLARVTPSAAAETGLPEGLMVVAGASDGTAGCIASGLRRVGDYNTTLGTTLVFKGVCRAPCRDPRGLIYSHKLPGGLWLPGAASNTGSQWITAWFGHSDPRALDQSAAARLPTPTLAYPLAASGERFPFLSRTATGFCLPEASGVDRYAACLQGVALLERLCYETLDATAGTSGGQVFSTGGGSHSDVWMQCRADATRRTLHRPECPEAALGAAILATCGARPCDLAAAVGPMVRIERSFMPRDDVASRYEELYQGFLKELDNRGYR
jgi:D-ribulokinase